MAKNVETCYESVTLMAGITYHLRVRLQRDGRRGLVRRGLRRGPVEPAVDGQARQLQRQHLPHLVEGGGPHGEEGERVVGGVGAQRDALGTALRVALEQLQRAAHVGRPAAARRLLHLQTATPSVFQHIKQ